jgi:hypothetical protein
LTVNIGLALLRTAVRGDDKYLGARLAALDQLYPFLNEALLGTFARLPDDKVDSGSTEEQLVRGTVDALTAKIPAVEGVFFLSFSFDISIIGLIIFFEFIDIIYIKSF